MTFIQDQLLATPVAMKAIIDKAKTEKPVKRTFAGHAGHVVPGETRTARQLSKGALGHKVPSPSGPLVSLKKVYRLTPKTV